MHKPLPKAVVFDFDGVVVNSKAVHSQAWKSAFAEVFGHELTHFPHAKLEGASPMVIANYICEQGGDRNKAPELFLLKDKHLTTKPFLAELLPGVHEILGFLKQKNIPYGIASNATRGFLEKNIKGLNIDVHIFTGFEDYNKPKPDPEAYVSLAEKLGVANADFSNIWIFEDSMLGLKAGKDAGMYTVGIQTRHSAEDFAKNGAKVSFKTLYQAWKALKLND